MTRYTSGGVSVTLAGDLDAWAERVVAAMIGESGKLIEQRLESIVTEAEANWYGPNGVKRVTGLSGDIGVTVSPTADGGVLVSVGSLDTRTVQKKRYRQSGGKDFKGLTVYSGGGWSAGREIINSQQVPVAIYCHRPSSLATRIKVATRKEFFDAPASTRIGIARKNSSSWRDGSGRGMSVKIGDYLIRVIVQQPGDGKQLLPIFVKQPAKAAIKALIPDLAKTLRFAAESVKNG